MRCDGMRIHRSLTVGLAVCASALAPAVANAASPGALTQLAGTSGCFLGKASAAKSARCATAHGLGSTQHVAISPDGRNVYASSNDSWGLVAFRRDAKTGKLRQLPGRQGCFTDVSAPRLGCTQGRGLVWAFWVAVSPDGRNVYVTGGTGNAIAVFRRNRSTGALTQLPGQAGCLRNRTGGTTQGGPPASTSGCQLVDGLVYPRTVVVSPDGAFVYAITSDGKTITGFRRDPATGALAPFDGGCVAQAAKPGCGRATNLAGGTDLTITRDGRHAYATAFKGNAVTAFSRDPATGVLTQVAGATGCVAATSDAGCAKGRGLRGVYNLALSPDERDLYAVSRFSKAIVVLARDPQTGGLSQPSGAAGCLAIGAAEGCGRAIGLNGARGLAVSPDGRTLYAGAFSDSAITAFRRDPATGALRQLAGKAGCLSYARTAHGKPETPGCAPARAIKQAWSVAISSDGRYVYSGVGGDGNSGLATFRRRP